MTASLPVCRSRGTLQGMAKKLKRPRDPVQLAKLIGDIATGQVEDTQSQKEEAPASVLARRAGMKGGVARAASLTAHERSSIAQKAAHKRWRKS